MYLICKISYLLEFCFFIKQTMLNIRLVNEITKIIIWVILAGPKKFKCVSLSQSENPIVSSINEISKNIALNTSQVMIKVFFIIHRH